MRPFPLLALVAGLALLARPVLAETQSVEAALVITMKTMAATLSDIEKTTRTDGQALPVEATRKLVVLAKGIPGLFPPGSELETLPGKLDAPPTAWPDVERFLDFQKRLVLETSRLAATAAAGGRDALAAQAALTRQACAACHAKFRD